MGKSRDPIVLVVEDDFLLARGLQVVLESKGARVLGPCASVSDALELIEASEQIDCALLDVRLGREVAFPVAEALVAREIRFALVSGYDAATLPPPYKDVPHFSKSADPDVLLRWVVSQVR